MHGEIDHHAHVRHAGRERADAGDGDRQDVLVADRFLERLDGWIEALDMTDHQDDAGPPRRGNDRATLLHRRCDRLLHQNMCAVLDADERKLPMQVGRSRDGHRIDAFSQQRLDAAKCRAAQRFGHETALLAVGIRDADELDPGKIGKDACVIAPHDADADHAYP